MKTHKKSIFVILFVFSVFTQKVTSETYNANQLIPAGHWIYDALYMIYNESGEAFLMDSAPLSVNEIKLCISYIDSENLSYSCQNLYDKITAFLEEKKFSIDMKPIRVGFNFVFNPAFMVKSNPDIEWSYGTDYAGVNKKANGDDLYGAGSGYYGDFMTAPFLKAPLYIDFADIAIIDCQASISKNFWGMTDNYNFMNIFYKPDEFEFSWPINANASVGYVFKNGLSVNFHVARTGLQYGHTKTGSIIYNDTFATDFYAQLRLSGRKLKYEMMVAEVDHTKFLYTHQIDFTVWKWLKLGVLEGTLLNKPFELRYFNPLMIMHSFGSWVDYSNEAEEKYYGESHICAYMGIKFDIVPCKNLRIYGLFAQTEIQPPTELGSPENNAIPDGVGLQLGLEYQHGDRFGGMYKFVLEGIYTHPYLYIKHSPDWTMWSASKGMTKNAGVPVCTWIGTPFGPDSLGGQFTAEYKAKDKWSADFSYLFLAHGQNSFGMFLKDENKISGTGTDKDGFYTYYPAARYRLGEMTAEEAAAEARSWALKGTIQYTNRVTLHGTYKLNEHFSFEGKFIYNFIFNNNSIPDNFQQGIETGVAVTYNLF